MVEPKQKAKRKAIDRDRTTISPTAHPDAANFGTQPSRAPKVGRPQIPPEYGIPKHTKDLLPWSYVSERMAQARLYWIATVDPGSRPHVTPVDGVWLNDRLYFGGSPKTRRNRNLAENPATCVHLESGSEAVILHGEVAELSGEDHELAQHLADASNEKYGYGMKAENYLAGGTFAFTPRKVIAWNPLFKEATRWEL